MFKALTAGCVLAAVVTVTASNHARAASLFRAFEAHARLYEQSMTYAVGLDEDGLLVTEEYNNSNRGFIQNFVFDSAAGQTHRFDDVVGRPSRPMPAGPIGGSRFYRFGVDGGIGYRYPRNGDGFVHFPGATAPFDTIALQDVGWLFNRHYGVGGDASGQLTLRTMPTAAMPTPAVVSSVALPDYRPESYYEIDSMNARSRVAGMYTDTSGSNVLRPFIWQPDLTGATSGVIDTPDIVRRQRGSLMATIQSPAGESVVINFINGYANPLYGYESILWTNGELVHLNELFGRDWVEVYDINSADRMLGVVADEDGSNHEYFLYSPNAGYQALTLEMIDEQTRADWLTFNPRFINDAGQIAGSASYRQTLANGSTINLSKAVLLTAVPEPGSLLGVAASLFALRARRRG